MLQRISQDAHSTTCSRCQEDSVAKHVLQNMIRVRSYKNIKLSVTQRQYSKLSDRYAFIAKYKQ